jgi:hypothetical protein
MRGYDKFDFKPEIVFDVLPTILNRLVISLVDGEIHLSFAALECYVHYLKLYKEFVTN